LCYKEEWRDVLGLSKKNITKKISKRAFGAGLLISVVMNTVILIVIVLFNLSISNLYGEISLSVLIVAATLIAPFAEEIMFRGFIQGSLTRKYVLAGKKKQVRNIIIIVAFLFTIAHFHYIINAESIILWLLLLSGIFIFSLYLGYLRNKYQSIIPTIFAHFGFNAAMAVLPFIIMILMLFQSDSNFQYKILQAKYTNDSIYNLDPNEGSTLTDAIHKFHVFHNPPRPELKEYFTDKKRVLVKLYYDIDTNGFVSNVRRESLKENIHPEIEKAAINVVESYPQHKPYIRDGEKTERTLFTCVPIYY